MYHFVATCAPELLELSEKVQIPGHVRQYLKDFQVEAVRFLHKHLAGGDFCILNDESGLGKCVATAVLLGVMAKNKRCLIIVQNDDELVTSWQFHFNVLTSLAVDVLGSNPSNVEHLPNIMITKWATLRSSTDVSKYNFDFIIIDNRGQMMSNSFCMSMLLSNYEHKVNLLISSLDVTSDLKLLHNALRLGGRLEHQYAQFKAFEAKYKLPNSKDVLNKQADLEEYFLKREMIGDYCRDFRLRRYRHQFENLLPHVDVERFKISLELWRTTTSSNSSQISNDNAKNLNINSETATEELFQQARALNCETSLVLDIPQDHSKNFEDNDDSDDALIMSPLLIDSASYTSDEAEVISAADIVTTPANNKHTEPDVYEFVDLSTEGGLEDCIGDVKLKGQKTINKLSERQTNLRSNINGSQLEADNQKKTTLTENIQNVASTKSLTAYQPATNKTKERSGIDDTPQKSTDDPKVVRAEVTDNLPTRTAASRKEQSLEQEEAKLKETSKKIEITRAKSNINKEKNIDVTKRQTRNQSKKKQESSPKCLTSPMGDMTDNQLESKHTRTKTSKIAPAKGTTSTPLLTSITTNTDYTKTSPKHAVVKENTNTNGKMGKRSGRLGVETPLVSTMRNTRSMQRVTRSSDNLKSKYMMSPPTVIDCNRKVRKRRGASVHRSDGRGKDGGEDECNIANDSTGHKESHLKSKTDVDENKKKLNETEMAKRTKKDIAITESTNTTELSALGLSDTSEDLECGQKLLVDTNSINGTERNCFLKPPTPNRAVSISQNKNSSTPSSLTDSEVVFVPSPNMQKKDQQVVVLTSSTDDGSVSSQQSTQSRRTRALKHKKSIKCPTSVTEGSMIPSTTSTFGELLAKQRSQRISPDIFSGSTDLGLTCTQQPVAGAHDGAGTFQGFKIFGSEVKQMQQQYAQNTVGMLLPRNRSCLNILDKMFEPISIDEANTMQPNHEKNSTKSEMQKSAHVRMATRSTRASQRVVPTLPKVAIISTQSQHIDTQPSQAPKNNTAATPNITSSVIEEEIFEITNNEAFGSMMRINSNGEISPIQTRTRNQQSTQHNKITNYLIGSMQSTSTDTTAAERTPSKRAQLQLSGTPMRRSPKNGSTQSTKLTKWFQKHGITVEDTIANAEQDQIPLRRYNRSAISKRLKKRCLELFFRN